MITTDNPEGYYTTMATLCGAKVMTMFGDRMFIVHWPYRTENPDERMHHLYGHGDTIEDASYAFLERNGLLP